MLGFKDNEQDRIHPSILNTSRPDARKPKDEVMFKFDQTFRDDTQALQDYFLLRAFDIDVL